MWRGLMSNAVVQRAVDVVPVGAPSRRLCMRKSKRALLAAVTAVLGMLFSSVAMCSSSATPAAAAGAACVDNPFGNRPLYLKGGFNGWSASPDYKFAYNCNRFELTANISGSSDFKVADANWSADADFGGGAAGSRPQPGVPLQLALRGSNLTYTFSGVQKVVLDVSQSKTAPKLTISPCAQNPLDDALLGLSGDFNGFTPRPADFFTYSCDG